MNKKAVAFVFVGAIALGFLKGGDAMAAYYGSDLSVDIEIEPSMTVTVPMTASTSITPSSAGAANTASVNLQVGTNSPGGYTATLTTVGSNSLQSNKLNTVDSSSMYFPTIPSVAYKSGGYGTTAAAFKSASGTAGKWALKVGSGAFQNVPEPGTATTVKTNNAMVASDSTTVTFVANLDMTVSPGTYSGEIAFIVVPNLSGFTDLDSAFMAAGKTRYYVNSTTIGYKMQDMSSAICNAVTTPTAVSGSDDVPRTILIDVRDNKPYWVAKLADGKCWMTQNLDLIISTSKTYTHDDTDLGYESGTATTWTPNRATTPRSSMSSAGVVPNWPANSSTGDGFAMAEASFSSGTLYYTDDSTYASSVCSSNNCNGYPSGGTFNDKFSSTPYNRNGLHGKVGTFYNRAAAQATNILTSTSTAKTSICPANWRLINNNDHIGIRNSYSITSSNANNMNRAPLYFTRAGQVNPDGTMADVGYGGAYMSSIVWVIQYNSGFVSSAADWGSPAYNGLTIRCVAR